MKIYQGRGMLTDRIKEKSKELFGYEITQRELRLFPYIQSIMVNEQTIDLMKINAEESQIIGEYLKKEYITFNPFNFKITITKEFWDKISEIIYLGYVDLHEN